MIRRNAHAAKAEGEIMKTKFAWLLLGGWALMIPFDPADGIKQPDLKSWFHNGSFDSAYECEASAGRSFKNADTKNQKQTATQLAAAKCIPIELIYKVKP
jgi:hypothetical protein